MANNGLAQIEVRYMKKKSLKPYIALEELDFMWDERRDIPEVIALWENGTPIEFIARNFGRSQEEVFLLLLDLSLKDKIKKRPGGMLGRSEQ